MKSLFVGAAAAALCYTAVPLAAQDRTPVTITGCVSQGRAGTFVLTNVMEMSGPASARATDAAPATVPSVIYWLSSSKGLKDEVGRVVEVTGEKSNNTDDGKVKLENKDGDTKIEVTAGSRKAEAKLDDPAVPVGTSGNDGKVEVRKPSQTLHVKSLRRIASSCSMIG